MNGYFNDWLENLHCLEQLFIVYGVWLDQFHGQKRILNSFFLYLPPSSPFLKFYLVVQAKTLEATVNPLFHPILQLSSHIQFISYPVDSLFFFFLTLLFKDSNLFSEVYVPSLKPYHFLPSLLQSLQPTCLLPFMSPLAGLLARVRGNLSKYKSDQISSHGKIWKATGKHIFLCHPGYTAGRQGPLQKKKKKCDVLSLANNGKRGRHCCMRTLWKVISCRDWPDHLGSPPSFIVYSATANNL